MYVCAHIAKWQIHNIKIVSYVLSQAVRLCINVCLSERGIGKLCTYVPVINYKVEF